MLGIISQAVSSNSSNPNFLKRSMRTENVWMVGAERARCFGTTAVPTDSS